MTDEMRQQAREKLSSIGMDLPDTTSVDVLITVLASLRQTSDRWGDSGYPGRPSVVDYARRLAATLTEHYDGGHR